MIQIPLDFILHSSGNSNIQSTKIYKVWEEFDKTKNEDLFLTNDIKSLRLIDYDSKTLKFIGVYVTSNLEEIKSQMYKLFWSEDVVCFCNHTFSNKTIFNKGNDIYRFYNFLSYDILTTNNEIFF